MQVLLTIPENLISTCFLRLILVWKFENLVWKNYVIFSDQNGNNPVG